MRKSTIIYKSFVKKLCRILFYFRTSVIYNRGKNNEYILYDEKGNPTKHKYIKNLKVKFRGSNNIVHLPVDLKLSRPTEISCYQNNIVKIGYTPHKLGLSIGSFSLGTKLIIGENVSMIDVNICVLDEPELVIEIGDDCMFSGPVVVRPSDGHSIIDVQNGDILNRPQPIKIKEHCWIGQGVMILKGTNIPKNSIVGANSLLTSKTAENISEEGGYIFAGVPAKPIKSGINWARENTYLYKEKVSSQK